MVIIIDGLIFKLQYQGGITRIFSEILPRLCDLDNTLKLKILIDSQIDNSPPRHDQINLIDVSLVERVFRPRRLWGPIHPRIKQSVSRLAIGNVKHKIWQSTYFSLPPFEWSGPKVTTVYDMIFEKFNNLYPNAKKTVTRKERSISQADRIICISNLTRDDLIDTYQISENKIEVIYPGCSDVFEVRSENEISLNIQEPFILFVGKRSRYKGFLDLLNAYASWPLNAEIRLVVAGASWSSGEKVILKELNLTSKVFLMEDVNDDQLCDLYNQAVAFVYPSLYEGFGIPLLEAMACGCPIVASRIPSTMEVTNDLPYYFETGSTESLSAALSVSVSEGKDTDRIQLGLERVKNFSWEKAAESTLNVYRSLF